MIFLFILILLSVMSTNAQEKTNTPVVANHQAICVVDLKRSAAFYSDIIGLQQIEEPFKVGRHAWFKTGPKTSLRIILGADQPKTYFKNNHMCFSVPDLDTFTAKLDKNKISYEDVNGKKSAITVRVDGVKQIWLQDPDHYWIEINNDPSMFR